MLCAAACGANTTSRPLARGLSLSPWQSGSAPAVSIRAFTDSFELLLATRVICGLGAGGVLPVALGLTGDLFPVDKRRVAMSRIMAGALTEHAVESKPDEQGNQGKDDDDGQNRVLCVFAANIVCLS